jgi:RHS repeat-associated protein
LYSNATYNALGELTQGTYGDGIVRTNIYDNRGRLTNRRDAPTYYALYLGYTGNGSVNYYNDSTAGDWNFTYDAFNRLATSSNLSNGNAFTYSYDQYGNRWKQVATAGGGPQPQYSFNSHNQIVGFTYDAAGNLTSDGSCNPCWTYDDRGNLIQGEGATFAYDGLGRRVQKISGGVTYDFFLNLDGTPWDEYQGTVHSRVNGGLFTYANNTTYFNRTDHLGTPRVTTDYTATIVRTESNLPFGDGFTETTSPFLDFVGYAGGFWDAESNADHFGAREYGKTQGRWLSPDPAGIGAVDPKNPQTWNRYAYVNNNPMSLTDPTGKYVSGCALVQISCFKKIARFEQARQKDLNSKNSRVRAGADAYGNFGQENGVHVNFANLGSNIKGAVNPSESGKGKLIDIEVTFNNNLKGGSLRETIAHEGTHVADDLNFLTSYDFGSGKYDPSLNTTHEVTEFNAYRAGAGVNHEHGFGPNDVNKIINFIHNSPAYRDNLYDPLFPNNTRFPQGDPVPPED